MLSLPLKALILTAGLSVIYSQRSILYYGLVSRSHLDDHIEKVVGVLGGGEPAKRLLKETAASETDYGLAIDKSWNVGVGIMQFDPIGFEDVKERISPHFKDIVQREFGVIVYRTDLSDLRHSPLLSVIFARLKYKLVPSAIPNSIQGRAHYWKRWYNSYAGAGTIEHYLDSAERNGLA